MELQAQQAVCLSHTLQLMAVGFCKTVYGLLFSTTSSSAWAC
jgi:hypothetical protein